MKDNKGRIIYVGKAINLRHRVGSESEALILEMTLIKHHMPMFNVRIKFRSTASSLTHN